MEVGGLCSEERERVLGGRRKRVGMIDKRVGDMRDLMTGLGAEQPYGRP